MKKQSYDSSGNPIVNATDRVARDAIDAHIADTSAAHAATSLSVSATDKLLGRVSASGGAVEEIPISDFVQTLLNDADAAAVLATLGIQTQLDAKAPLASPVFTGQVTITTNTDEALKLVGDDNTFIGLYPDGAGAGRKGHIGFPSSDALEVVNEIANGHVRFTPNGNGRVITSKVIESEVSTGTNPIAVASTTACPNLNADMVDGQHASAFAAASHAHALDDLSDVNTAGVVSGDVLTWNGSAWVAQAPSGSGGLLLAPGPGPLFIGHPITATVPGNWQTY